MVTTSSTEKAQPQPKRHEQQDDAGCRADDEKQRNLQGEARPPKRCELAAATAIAPR